MNRFRSNDNGNNRFSSLKSTESINVFLSPPTNSNNNNSNNNNNNNSNRFNSISKYSSRHSNNNSNTVSVNDRVHVQSNDHFPELTSNKPATPVIDTVKESPSVIQPNKPMSLAEMVKGGNIKEQKLKEELAKEKAKANILKPGWVYFNKNSKSGKTAFIYGPKTIYQKKIEQKEVLENNLNYQMNEAISRLIIRWDQEKQKYDDYHGFGMFQARYGYEPIYDDYDSDYDSDDSDYEDDFNSD